MNLLNMLPEELSLMIYKNVFDNCLKQMIDNHHKKNINKLYSYMGEVYVCDCGPCMCCEVCKTDY